MVRADEHAGRSLEDPLTENTTLAPMAHCDTDGDEACTFAESGASADGPAVANGSAVVAVAPVTVQTVDGGQTTEAVTATMTEGMSVQTTGDSGPGFSVIVALLAVLAAALLAVCRGE